MESINNFRDFGGYKTKNGARLKKGLLYRSGDLSKATSADLEKISALGIKTICDLRSERERRVEPDRFPDVEPITFFNIPMRPIVDYHARSLGRLFSLMFGEERSRDYIAESYKAYREYATGYLPQFKSLLKRISKSENLPVLIHCSAGKDRTGVLSNLIQQMVGVSPETAQEDYLKTNENLSKYKEEIIKKLKRLAYFGVPWKMYMPLFDARTDYLNAAFAQVKDEFGAVDDWIRRGLGFSEQEQVALAEVLLG
ncbi:MAG: tyrosine-protein phosphatase [Anaerolineae bacterium]|jgi:protein-tyrosine phosphatase|nr:tyrosine-protein phosphatase [Anaerolineae bacterium]MBT3714568.1 tyrosine-protein phosphatase [Anaerolineae bacterium]MBT4310336.1 tyrosine-protein phosphatase [Anaerolineae bacterium]MBT4458292.1 tyrosine-protein phosphatase [Anaerolineae bacterium]MBT4841963.1 tyrosine-protein phosphatase [Anaerolineae bacterium]